MNFRLSDYESEVLDHYTTPQLLTNYNQHEVKKSIFILMVFSIILKMATKWYGGIPAGKNYWATAIVYAEGDKDTYIVGGKVFNNQITNTSNYVYWGITRTKTIKRVLLERDLESLADSIENVIVWLEPGTEFYLEVIGIAATSIVHTLSIDAVSLAQLTTERTREECLRLKKSSNQKFSSASKTTADATKKILEHQNGLANEIIPPWYGAAAGALTAAYLKFNHADDDAAGAGAQEVTVDYISWPDKEVKTHPVASNGNTNGIDLVGTEGLTDIFAIRTLEVTKVGANGINTGEIYVQNLAT